VLGLNINNLTPTRNAKDVVIAFDVFRITQPLQ